MKLTKEQRIEGYKFARERINTNEFRCICDALRTYLICESEIDYSILPASWKMSDTYFSELKAYNHEKLEDITSPWWPVNDKETRIKVLTEIIDKLEKE